ncbi:hypothetical protein [Mycetocola spongiae]|uniref:hypothetical protein n=1 Tax=Mycetocola spongiae TaxID=2859226 RepID=UPI001CF37EFA|nr:hypothetical protein [Mycetocola spongiae]UCR90026.1 hypothetical protein KXZ72_05000 [Mycetocola spongiae]
MKTRTGHRLVVVVLCACVLSGCGAQAGDKNILGSQLGQSLDEVTGIRDPEISVSILEDSRLGQKLAAGSTVNPAEAGWVVSAICADNPSLLPGRTKEIQLSVIRAEFLNSSTAEEVKQGKFQDARICGNTASYGPE